MQECIRCCLSMKVSHCCCLQEFENLKESPSEGVYIYGLFLEGCAWSGRENKLVDPEPKKLYHPLPVLYVTGVQAKVRGAARLGRVWLRVSA